MKKLRRREAEGAMSRGQGRGGERGEEREQPVTREEEAGGGELGRHGDAPTRATAYLACGAEGGYVGQSHAPSVLLRAWWTCCISCIVSGAGRGARWVWDSGSASPNSVACSGQTTGTFTLRPG